MLFTDISNSMLSGGKRELIAADDLPVKEISSEALTKLLKSLPENEKTWKIREVRIFFESLFFQHVEVKGGKQISKRFVIQSLVLIDQFDVKKLVNFLGEKGQSAHINGGTQHHCGMEVVLKVHTEKKMVPMLEIQGRIEFLKTTSKYFKLATVFFEQMLLRDQLEIEVVTSHFKI